MAPKYLGGAKLSVAGGVRFWVGCTFHVELYNVTLYNVEGFETEHMATVKHIGVCINLAKLIASCGKKVEVTLIKIEHCNIIFEKQYWSSNIDAMQKKINAAAEEEQADAEAVAEEEQSFAEAAKAAKAEAEAAAKAKAEAAKAKAEEAKANADKAAKELAQHKKQQKTKKKREVTLKNVMLTDVTVQITGTHQHQAGVMRKVVALKDIKFDHFSEEFGSKQKASSASFMIEMLIGTILKTVLHSIVNVGEGVTGTVSDSCAVS